MTFSVLDWFELLPLDSFDVQLQLKILFLTTFPPQVIASEIYCCRIYFFKPAIGNIQMRQQGNSSHIFSLNSHFLMHLSTTNHKQPTCFGSHIMFLTFSLSSHHSVPLEFYYRINIEKVLNNLLVKVGQFWPFFSTEHLAWLNLVKYCQLFNLLFTNRGGQQQWS